MAVDVQTFIGMAFLAALASMAMAGCACCTSSASTACCPSLLSLLHATIPSGTFCPCFCDASTGVETFTPDLGGTYPLTYGPFPGIVGNVWSYCNPTAGTCPVGGAQYSLALLFQCNPSNPTAQGFAFSIYLGAVNDCTGGTTPLGEFINSGGWTTASCSPASWQGTASAAVLSCGLSFAQSCKPNTI